MKRYILFFLMLLNINFIFADNIWISLEDTIAYRNPGEIHVFEAYIHNSSQNAFLLKAVRTVNEIPDAWTTSMCIGTKCYHYLVNETDLVGIDPGDSVFFDITFNTDTIPGYGQSLIVFEDIISSEQIEQLFSVETITPEPSFSVSVKDTAADTLAGQSHEFSGYVFNNSAKAFTAFLVREENNIPAGWSTTLCFGSCPTSDVDSVNSLIQPGDSLEYKVTFYSDATPADGNVHMLFYADGEADTVRQTFSLHTTSTAIGDTPGNTISNFELLGNYPNPFNPTTAISYSLKGPLSGQLSAISRVELTVYDISGKAVQTLVNERQEAGRHNVQFNASNLSSGTYLYQLKANGQVKTGKMLLLK